MDSADASRYQIPEALATEAPWTVEGLHEWKVDDSLAMCTAPSTEIGILEEEEEALVEAVQCHEKFSRDQEASTHDPIDILHFVAIGGEHEVPVESFIKYFPRDTASGDEIDEPRVSADGQTARPIRMQKFWPEDADR